MRQMRVSDGSVVWDDFGGMPVASLPAKFRMPDIERRELEALRQRTEESVSSFISRWRGKIAEIVDRPSERDQIQMVLRSLQPRIARHVVGVRSQILDLWLWLCMMSRTASREVYGRFFPGDVKGKKPFWDRGRQMALRGLLVSYTATGQPCYAAQFTPRPAPSYPRPRAQQTSAPFALRTQRQFSQIGMPLSQALRKLTEAGPGHETDRCTALRHAIQDLIDQGLVHLGQPSVTTNPLPTHTTHAVPPPAGGIHFLDFDETDDHVHMLSWDDPDPEPIMPAGIYETSGVTLEPQMPLHSD
ncbi:hypothetical protein CK203_065095 [Vitis vinifera]|uniref:Retrotransposon gag domain-containing protein n=1 Tax=Vitis vinifera TaxID=29760 RepID=A0A438G2P6_VITVI|nr:hypothetical protein CK203_065095 [Vitis vinifera]